MSNRTEPRIARGGAPGSYFFYRPNEVLLGNDLSKGQQQKVKDVLGPEAPPPNDDGLRSIQRKRKRERHYAPFGYSIYPFDPTTSGSRGAQSAEHAIELLQASGVSAQFNFVSSRTPMRSHAVSYAEPAELDASVPPLQQVTEGTARLRVGVLDTGRPHYGPEFLHYYEQRHGLSLNRPVGTLDDIFLRHARPDHADEPSADQDTMVAPFGRLTHPHAGHGMFVSSIIARQEPAAGIVAQATMHEDGIADLFEMLVDLEDACDEECTLLNMSLGFRSNDDACPVPLEDALTALEDRGVLLVTSAGNDGNGREMWPAAHDSVVAVAATDAAGKPTDWSNFGRWIDACALGDDVVANYIFADWDFPDGTAKRFRGAAKWSGTSFAAPLVTGLIAKEMAADRRINAREAWQRVRSSGTSMDDAGEEIPALYGVRIQSPI